MAVVVVVRPKITTGTSPGWRPDGPGSRWPRCQGTCKSAPPTAAAGGRSTAARGRRRGLRAVCEGRITGRRRTDAARTRARGLHPELPGGDRKAHAGALADARSSEAHARLGWALRRHTRLLADHGAD